MASKLSGTSPSKTRLDDNGYTSADPTVEEEEVEEGKKGEYVSIN